MFTMGVLERRRREKAALRKEILSAARELFAKEGYESVSMRRVADQIEYSPTTIYLYFRDKEELVREICDETFALLTRKLEKVITAETDPVAQLRAGLRAYIEFGIKHPDHYRVTLMMPHHHQPGNEIHSGPGAEAFESLVQGVTRCVEAGRFRETDVMAISQSLWTTIHGITALQISHGDCFPWVDRRRLIDLTIDTMIRGLEL
jgi:AcrR family transcriptional regulator